MLILADAHRRWYDSSDKAPDTGTSVILTLDEKIQYIAEKELTQAIQDTHAKSGTVIVENPATGELLAVANSPTFNPNAAKDSSADSRMDRAASALYEPGSVFKIVTLSAAIDQGITNPDEMIDCQNGAIYIAGHRIRDHKPYGLLSVAQVLANSSDVGAIKTRAAAGRAEILRVHPRVSASASRPAWTCRGRAAECFAGWKIGRRFRSARFRWGRKSA
jgi:cell division protein FtsI (penicillin-binding protein 3)